MNEKVLKDGLVQAAPAGDKESMVKQLLLATARGTGAGLARMVLSLLAAVIVNGLGVAAVLAFSEDLRSGGRGAGIMLATLVVAPFVLAVGFIGMMAYRQSLMGILSRLLETQASALGGLGADLLERFFRSVNYQAGSPVSEAFLGQWRKFLKRQEGLPRPLPFLLTTLIGKVPLSDTITRVATSGSTLREVAHDAMADMVGRAINGGFRPETAPLLGALAGQFALWLALAALLHYR